MGQRDELIRVVQEMIAHLTWANDRHWLEWMHRVLQRLNAGDDSGADLLLSNYGGMGSFGDFDIGKTYVREGRIVWEPGHEERNDQFNELRERAWRLATDQVNGRTVLDRLRLKIRRLSAAERKLSAIWLSLLVVMFIMAAIV